VSARIERSRPGPLSPLCLALRAALHPKVTAIPRRALLFAGLASFAPLSFAAPFPAHFDVAALDGDNGFAFAGIDGGDRVGTSVSDAGDVNGDGVDDFIFGAPGAGPHGASYVVFGGTIAGGALFDVSQLDGSNGFRLDGPGIHDYGDAEYDDFGESVSAGGDINSDGIADIVAAASLSDRYGGYAGAAFVVFGHTGAYPPSFEVPAPGPNDPTGFRIHNAAGGTIGPVADAGDVNGDGVDDLLLGSPSLATAPTPGAAFVVFGGPQVAETGGNLADLHGDNGFAVPGEEEGALMGTAVSGLGDINGDGFDDFVVAAPGDGTSPARTYVMFGGSGIGGSGSLDVSTLDGSNGFVLDVAPNDNVLSVAGGDVNGDGIADLLIGFPAIDANGPRSGATYVVFGGAGIGGNGSVSLSSLDGSNGFVLLGDGADWSGVSVAAGDVTGDAIADIVVAASGTGTEPTTGKAYVVFGRHDLGGTGTFDLSSLDGANGFAIEGIPTASSLMSVSTGADINADGVEDIIVGSPYASPEAEHSGETYVIYGKAIDVTPPTCTAVAHPARLWPPNHRWVDVRTRLEIDDASASTTFELVSVTSNQPQASRRHGDVPNDIRGWRLHKPDTEGFLRAERIGGERRVYTLSYKVTDAAGNSGQCSATVKVPRDLGG
jgi:hypothetical protein